MDGICEAAVPAGAAGVCGYSEADKKPLLWCFPLSALFSTAAGDSQDSKHTRGAYSCPFECTVMNMHSKRNIDCECFVCFRLALLHSTKVQ